MVTPKVENIIMHYRNPLTHFHIYGLNMGTGTEVCKPFFLLLCHIYI